MDTSTSVSPEKLSETELVNFLAHYAIANEYSIALWQLPYSSVRHLIISRQYIKLKKEATVIEELPEGFIFAPFDREKESIFLPGDFIFSFENGALKQPEDPAGISSASWLRDRLKQPGTPRIHFTMGSRPPVGSKEDYLNLI